MTYGDSLHRVGLAHPDVVVLDAGLGSSMQTAKFAAAFPSRYFNLGIAEQNAVSVASGIARRGLVPLMHTFSNFLARRAHDQVAVSVAWPGCNVKMVGGSCGVFDGRNGPSHLAIDDLAVMTALPDVFVAEPGDERQADELLELAVDRDGPAYIRVRRHGAPADLLPGVPFAPTAVVYEQAEATCTLVASGSMLGEAMVATLMLADEGVPVDLLHVAVLHPLDAGPIIKSASRTGRVAVAENHVATGGFGDAVAQALGALPVFHARLALPRGPLPAGDPQWLLAHCGLDARSLAARVATFAKETHAV